MSSEEFIKKHQALDASTRSELSLKNINQALKLLILEFLFSNFFYQSSPKKKSIQNRF
tara:strand:+ start:570 stop:743 length:174 start_codon:yes stop_codon:yes gene_type:complete